MKITYHFNLTRVNKFFVLVMADGCQQKKKKGLLLPCIDKNIGP